MKAHWDKSPAEVRYGEQRTRVLKFLKKIRMEVACHRSVTNSDAIEYVKRTLDPHPPASGGILLVTLEYGRHGGISRVMFVLCGTPTLGEATLHSDNGSIAPFQNSCDDYTLHVQNYGARAARRTRNAGDVAMFLQVARLEAERVGYRETDGFTY